MPRHPEGQRAMTDAERSARKRARISKREKLWRETLASLAGDERLPEILRHKAAVALMEGKDR